jgi:hypothetical protein
LHWQISKLARILLPEFMNDFRIAGNKPSDHYFPAPGFLPAYRNEGEIRKWSN